MSRPRCILVDDDRDFGALVRTCLRRISPDLEIVTFRDGTAALEFISSEAADILVTDFKMPGLDGLALTREVRTSERGRDLPIVVMSGDELATDALASGADVFLAKRDLIAAA